MTFWRPTKSIRSAFSLILALMLIMATGCDPNAPEKPDKLIAKGKMTKIMLEIHLAEGKLDEMKGPKDKKEAFFHQYAEKIYEKYEIDSATYRQSYDYYLNDLSVMESFYQSLNDTLEELSKEVKKK